MTHVGIVEIGELCVRMQAASDELFEVLGGWVTSTDEAALQRLLAAACHRHAWHAELWDARRPDIPTVPDATPSERRWPSIAAAHPSERGHAYAAVLDELCEELSRIADRIDPTLDPSTHRTIDLVTTDLQQLRAALP